MNTSPGWNTFAFSRGFAYAFMRYSAQPVIFNHSSRGLGHDPQQAFLCLYIQTHCLRSLCLKKLRSYLLKIVLVFSLSSCGKQCLWLSIATNYLLGLPQTPVYAESILRLRVHGTLPMRAAQSLKRYLISKKLGVLYSTYEADRKNLQ